MSSTADTTVRRKRLHDSRWSDWDDPPDAIEIDVCVVCTRAVFDDPTGAHCDAYTAVETPDGRHTHSGCADGYDAAVARREAAQTAVATYTDVLDADHTLGVSGTAVSAQSVYVEQQRERDRLGDRITRTRCGAS